MRQAHPRRRTQRRSRKPSLTTSCSASHTVCTVCSSITMMRFPQPFGLCLAVVNELPGLIGLSTQFDTARQKTDERQPLSDAPLCAKTAERNSRFSKENLRDRILSTESPINPQRGRGTEGASARPWSRSRRPDSRRSHRGLGKTRLSIATRPAIYRLDEVHVNPTSVPFGT